MLSVAVIVHDRPLGASCLVGVMVSVASPVPLDDGVTGDEGEYVATPLQPLTE